MSELETLRKKISELELKNKELENLVLSFNRNVADLSTPASSGPASSGPASSGPASPGPESSGPELLDLTSSDPNPVPALSFSEYKRYGRQMIVPDFGSLTSQLMLKSAKILVIGAGGLGCPALLYLTAAGVGTIGIVDNDTVDESNLHRQVLHTTSSIGMLKCESARRYLTNLNPNVQFRTHATRLTNDNAFGIVEHYDLVVDCTDTPATRYLINDVCVLSGKTIVSGSGVRTDGQISIFNHENTGPCYRCFYPKPPSPQTISTCSDAGVLGPAIGLTGIALATETIKVLTGFYKKLFQPFLTVFSAYPQQTMRVFKMRGKQKSCVVCGANPSIGRVEIESYAVDYSVFCGSPVYDVIAENCRISVLEARSMLDNSVLLDVRPKEQFEITHIAGSLNVEWERTLCKVSSIDEELPDFNKDSDTMLVICRYGNNSQLAVKRLSEMGYKNVFDIKGGLNRWSEEIDSTIPIY